MAYDGSLKFDTKIDTSGFEQGASKIGEMAKNALSVFAGNLMTSAVNKIGELGQMALQAGTEFEAAMAKASTLYTGTDAEFEKLSCDILKLLQNRLLFLRSSWGQCWSIPRNWPLPALPM